ncbi:MAG: Ig-like domain repeat protein [Terriglobales bacterium]
MKIRMTRLIMRAAIAAMVVVAGSAASWAQSCPTSPLYSPDFTANQSCLTLNGNASFPAPTGSAATITSWSGAGGIVTFIAPNSFTAGEPISLSGFVNSTFFNGLAFPVLGTGLSSTQFEIAFSGYSGSTDTGTATPLNVLQLTPYTTYQAGSAWYNTSEPVAGGFSTTFTFQLSGAGSSQQGYPNADGIAFVIQNSVLTALGPYGCGIGFGDSSSGCAPPTGGIPNSLAVEFNTFFNPGVDQNNNSVSIQSNGTNANCVDPTCTLPGGLNYNLPVTLADGNIHTVTISYALQSTPTESNCFVSGNPGPCLDVLVDGNDLFPAGVAVNLVNLLSLINNSTAWVGFTAATGAEYDSQDILSWTFSPLAQSQTSSVTPTTPAAYSYNGGCNSNGSGCTSGGFNNTVGENPGSSLTINNMVLTPIPIIAGSGTNAEENQAACNVIVDALNPNTNTSPFVDPNSNPPQTAQCFVYQNAGGTGFDAPLMFSVTCPPSGVCDTTQNQFYAALASYFNFTCTENPPLIAPTCSPVSSPSSFGNFANPTSTTGYPAVGFLQGTTGADPNNPCNLPGPGALPLFQTNQVASFVLGDTGSVPVKGGSGLLTSCWVAVYDTPGEMPTAAVTSGTNGSTYQQGSVVNANYACTAVSTDPDSILDPNGYPAAGPYLTVSTCTATSGLTAGGGSPTSSSCIAVYPPALNSCSGVINLDTSETGPHTLTVDSQDSAMSTAVSTVTYDVQGSSGTAVTSSANPSFYGQSVTFTASVAGVTPTGTVTWSTGCGTTTVTAGVAKCSTSGLPVGTDAVTASYSGDVNNAPSIGTLGGGGQVVNLASTTTTVVSSLNPSVAGQSVTFTATVNVTAGQATPTGAVTWSSNTGCAAGLTCTTSSLAVGTDTVTATYAGDAYTSTSNGSVSGGQVVSLASTTTKVSSSTNPSVAGQSVTFTATVAVVAPGVGTPTGTVGWSSNTGCGTTAVSAGKATCTTSSLPGGTDTVTANYNGDATHGTSNGSVSQVVNAVLTVTPMSLTFGTTTTPLYPGQSGPCSPADNYCEVTVTNPGSSSIKISSITIGGTNSNYFGDLGFFCSGWGPKGGTLAPGASCPILIDAWQVPAPAATSESPFIATAYLAITPQGGSAIDVQLTTYVINPVASFSATGLSQGKLTFPTTTKNNTSTVTITVKNTGTTPLIFSNPAISGVSAPFSASAICSGETVQPNGTCGITVTFAPTANGTFTGTLKITDNAQNSPQQISLSGTT